MANTSDGQADSLVQLRFLFREQNRQAIQIFFGGVQGPHQKLLKDFV